VLTEAQQLVLPLEPGRTFSLLSLLADAQVSVQGAKYPLDGAVLEVGVGLGVSNLIVQKTTVTVHHGLVAIIAEDSASL
jgi:thiamine pyrophosphokinase